jgi:hypothetical protein
MRIIYFILYLMFLQSIKHYFQIPNTKKFINKSIPLAKFTDKLPSIKINDVVGMLKPKLKSQTPNSDPRSEFFYGLPMSKDIPKSREDLKNKIEYLNNFEDMMDIFSNSIKKFDGETLSLFLERLYL